MITELTGLDVANASLLDEATAAAEALFMSYSVHKMKRNKFYLSNSVFPQTVELIKTKAFALGIEIVHGNVEEFDWSKASEYCGMLVQNPDNFGNVHDYEELSTKLKESKMVFTIVADILSTTITKSPAEMGADIACGSV
jgi:glycine dehydrogenase